MIAIDAMGGDRAPDIVLEGVALYLKKNPQASFMLFGNEDILNSWLQRHPKWQKNIRIQHCPTKIAGDEKPAQALRPAYKDSSMRLAIESVRDGKAQAVVSAGNTGALMALSKILLRPLDGIERPAICSFLPNLQGVSAVCDLGANVGANPENLQQFAMMACTYFKLIYGKNKPSIGILNIGTEDAKGTDTLQQAAELLKNADFGIYQGFVEGDDIGKGGVDVIVTDGFTGNVALKTVEGTVKFIVKNLWKNIKNSPLAYIGLPFLLPALLKLKKSMDPRTYNGAIFLGLNGISVKSHGGTDGLGFYHAIVAAQRLVDQDITNKLREQINKRGEQ